MEKIKFFILTLLCMVGVINVMADDVINQNMANTVDGHFKWVQEVPEKGKLYKIVNGTSTADRLIAVAPRGNSTVQVSNGDSSSSLLVNDMVLAGEWLYGDDNTITSVSAEGLEGIYEGRFGSGDNRIGANWDQVWDIAPITLEGVSGYYISCSRPGGHCYLKQSNFFDVVDDFVGTVGSLGWSVPDGVWWTYIVMPWVSRKIDTKNHVWNFYSMDQYDCYLDFKTAYEDFMSMYEEFKDNEEYQAVCNDVNEDGKRWQGDNDASRTETYDIIDRMLNVIATLKGGGDIDIIPDGQAEWPIDNPGSEHDKSFDSWKSRRIPTSFTSKASKTIGDDVNPTHKDAAMFELKNATMSQIVTGLKSGVYELSVYWKTDNNPDAEITLNAKSSAEEKCIKVAGNEASPKAEDKGFTKSVVEVVVVDGRLTVSATANTANGGSVYLDDFDLKYICKNYWYEEEQTRVYRGVFLNTESSGAKVDENPDGKERKDPDGKASAVVDDKIPFADITQAYFVSFEFDNSKNPNGLCYTKAETTKKITTIGKENEVNVIRCHVDKDGNIVNGECKSLMLEDGHPYSAKTDFKATNAHYQMQAVGAAEGEDYQYGSLILPYNATIPSGVAYKVGINGEVLELSEVTGVIPANTPVLVTNTGAFDGSVVDVDKADVGIYSAEDLHGVYTLDVKAPVDSYVLQIQNNHLAYYQVKENKRDKLTIKPFRSYLMDNAGQAKSLAFDIVPGETDGLSEIVNGLNKGEIYDLSGRRVEKMVRGIYVVNGKKVLVK